METENFPTAEALRKRAEDAYEQKCKENHKKWLESIKEGIYNAAVEGKMFYYAKCGGWYAIKEIKLIYEPLGYRVSQTSDY